MWKYLIPYIDVNSITSEAVVAPVQAIIARFQAVSLLVLWVLVVAFGQEPYQVEALVLQGLAGLETFPLVVGEVPARTVQHFLPQSQ
jgi:hypothetical protein